MILTLFFSISIKSPNNIDSVLCGTLFCLWFFYLLCTGRDVCFVVMIFSVFVVQERTADDYCWTDLFTEFIPVTFPPLSVCHLIHVFLQTFWEKNCFETERERERENWHCRNLVPLLFRSLPVLCYFRVKIQFWGRQEKKNERQKINLLTNFIRSHFVAFGMRHF